MCQVDLNILIAMYPGAETGAVSLHSIEQDLRELQSAGFLTPKPPVSWLFSQVPLLKLIGCPFASHTSRRSYGSKAWELRHEASVLQQD